MLSESVFGPLPSGPGPRNRTGTGNWNLFYRTVLQETGRGAGTVGTVFQEPEPSLSVETVLKQKNPRGRVNREVQTGPVLLWSNLVLTTEPKLPCEGHFAGCCVGFFLVLFCYIPSAQKSGVDKRVVSKRVVFADVPLERKPERGYIGMFPQNEKAGTRVRSNVPRNENRNEGTFAKTTLLRNRPFISK